MCQMYEGERRFMVSMELAKIEEKWRRHESGEEPLTDEQIKELAVRKLLLLEN